MPLGAKITVVVNALLTGALDLGEAHHALDLPKTVRFADGTGLNQVSRLWHDRRPLAASATEDLDVAGGGLVDALGVAFSLTKVKAIVVAAASTNTNNVNVSRGANGVPFLGASGDLVPVVPGGLLVLVAPTVAGYPVTPGTGDLITVTNAAGATPVTYEIAILGA